MIGFIRMITRYSLVTVLMVLGLLSSYALFSGAQTGEERRRDITGSLSGEAYLDFARALEVREFKFPEDSGPHPEFQTEWWYYTGNLEDQTGRRFGYQLTFFRRALSPDSPDRESAWASNQVYFAHFTVSDIENKKFYSAERWHRAALGLAGAQAEPHKVWIGDWSSGADGNEFYLKAGDGEFSIDLNLTPAKPVVLQGDQGLSQKGPEPGNASYYYAMTRLKTDGVVKLSGQQFRVNGLSWLDREWSTSVLGEDLSGWDWFSLQLDGGRDVMLYQLRGKDGSIGEHSAGAVIGADGKKTNLAASDFEVEVLDRWKSPETGAVYPSKWQVSIPSHGIKLTVIPYQNNQELNLSFVYWEGAVRAVGDGLSGSGYVELTGY